MNIAHNETIGVSVRRGRAYVPDCDQSEWRCDSARSGRRSDGSGHSYCR